MQYTEQFTEKNQPLDYGIYQVFSPGTHNTPYVAVNRFQREFVHVFIGNMGNTAEVDIDIVQATDIAGTGSKLVKSATQVEQAEGHAIAHVAMEMRSEELDVDGGFDCIGLEIVVANNPVEIMWIVWGTCPDYAPVATTFWHEIVQ